MIPGGWTTAQGAKLRAKGRAILRKSGAGDGIQTLDLNLGKGGLAITSRVTLDHTERPVIVSLPATVCTT